MLQASWNNEERAAYYEKQGYWEPHTLGERLKVWSDTHGDRVAITDVGRRLTFAELERSASELAAGFWELGIRKGDRLIVQLPNGIDFVLICFALFRLGALPILSMPTNRASEIDSFCRVARPVAYVTTSRFLGFDYKDLAHSMMQEHSSLRHLISDDGKLDGSIPLGSLRRPPRDLPAPHYRDPAVLLLSGGTTAGTPKLIPRTHTDYAYNATASAARCKLSADTVYLAALPAAHNFPLACPGIFGTLSVGGRVVMSKTTSCDEAFPLIEKERVTVTALVPALLNLWLEARNWDESDLSSLRLLQVGGAPLSEAMAAQVEPLLGCRLQQVFGMAEGLLCYTQPDDPKQIVLSTQGRPLSEADELLFVDACGNALSKGEPGELLVRGPYTIQGYYRAEEVNRVAFTSDGYYRTGDLARLTPSGSIQVLGRIKDQINRAGEKISVAEVESHLGAHPDVKEVAVVGVPDKTLGERNCAFVRSGNPDLDLGMIHRFLRARGLAPFKMPDQLELMDASWPLTSVGKIDKRELASRISRRTIGEKPSSD